MSFALIRRRVVMIYLILLSYLPLSNPSYPSLTDESTISSFPCISLSNEARS